MFVFYKSGEVKIVMDPQQHKLQYSKLLANADDGHVSPSVESHDTEEGDVLRSVV